MRGMDGLSPLVHTTTMNNTALVRLLLDHGAGGPQERSTARSCLTIAIGNRNHEIIELLLKYGEDVNDGSIYQFPLMSATQLGDVDLVQRLINHGARVNMQDFSGNTALHRAVSDSQPDICAVLVSSGADVFLTNKSGDSPLDLIRKSGNHALFIWLLYKPVLASWVIMSILWLLLCYFVLNPRAIRGVNAKASPNGERRTYWVVVLFIATVATLGWGVLSCSLLVTAIGWMIGQLFLGTLLHLIAVPPSVTTSRNEK